MFETTDIYAFIFALRYDSFCDSFSAALSYAQRFQGQTCSGAKHRGAPLTSAMDPKKEEDEKHPKPDEDIPQDDQAPKTARDMIWAAFEKVHSLDFGRCAYRFPLIKLCFLTMVRSQRPRTSANGSMSSTPSPPISETPSKE